MNVLITGSSSGLGFALAENFIDLGHNVYCISKSHTWIEGNAKKSVICDFRNLADVARSIKELCEGMYAFDYVFLNAGMLGSLNKQRNTSVFDYQEIFNVNVLANKVILDYLFYETFHIQNVIGISSGASEKTYGGWGLYCCSKAAFRQLISSYSDDFPETNFVSLAPGLVKTKMQDRILGEDADKIPSVKKFHDAYPTMDSADTVAKKIIDNLDQIKKFTDFQSGGYLDLRSIYEK
jgi:NADP-dependent 3-hydroxy acid dehydrogenase YdfG